MAKRGRAIAVAACIASACLLSGLPLIPRVNFLLPAFATRLSPELTKTVSNQFKDGKVRLDGAVETADGRLYLPLLPLTPSKKPKADVDVAVPSAANPSIIFYSNGWAHVLVKRKGDANVLDIPTGMAEKFQKRLLGLHFPSDLIVPQGFAMPRSMKGMISDVPSISLVDDAVISAKNFGEKPALKARAAYKGNGSVFLTSITSGSITMLDGKTFKKIAEFPTEGTPCGMDLTNDKLYIADEAKNRLLILDPVARKFSGQIDLPPKCAPKAVAVAPGGNWLYVSESAAGEIVSIETATGKPLMKTKVPPGPGKLAVTPDGAYLLVLDVTCGGLSIISTHSQKLLTTLKVGDMPTSLALSSDSKLAYVSNRMTNSVSVVDIPNHAVIKTIKCAQAPTGVALSPDNSKLYVCSGRENSITEFDTKTGTAVNELKLPGDIDFPGGLCLLPDGHTLLVSSHASEITCVINADKLEIENKISLGHPNHETVWEPVP